MSQYRGLIFLLVCCWIIQIVLSYFQHKNYRKVINENKKRNSGYLGVGVSKAKFNLGQGIILIVVTDETDSILEFKEMSGITTFARFKEKKEFIGKTTAETIKLISNTKRKKAFEQAVSCINNEKRKMEEL